MQIRRTAVFILSADYSGSTWAGYVLGSNRNSAFLGEYYRAWHDGYFQPCTVCAARGRAECAMLHGIQSVPVDQAFAWGFERTGKPVLVDSSKVTHWAARASNTRDDYDIRMVHLIRDPRGWLASQRRRTPELDHLAAMPRWLAINSAIRDFVGAGARASETVVYDELAAEPVANFTRLFDFCGLKFTLSALAYWNFEHHGFAANGATSPIIPGGVARARIPQFVTRDEDFYSRRKRTQFSDDRWRQELPAGQIEGVMNNPAVASFLRSIDRELTLSGIADTRRSAASLPPKMLHRAWSALRGAVG